MSYKIDFLIPPDHQEFVAEILIDRQFVARLSREEGLEKTKIEFFRGHEEFFVCNLAEFEEALQSAKAGLKKRDGQGSDNP